MSADPTDKLFAAVRTKLLADAQIASAVADRVVSDWGVPLDAPFIRLSVPRALPYDDECGEGAQITLRVHVFAEHAGPIQCATIAGRVRSVLDNAAFPIDGHDLDEITYERTDYLGDADNPRLRMGIAVFNVLTTAI
ncbi:DUF3168 domain-containing protein [Hyphomicrobium sp. CS1GBMeth3]|uniref:DUF3168 domain-containing protein n=1 Tax=Hyphomicrobium sp. CS1GBMeth3 TaxID=1892845 RepID=UPI000930BAD8|nr:DUF3168 domain-containing protein [Hyphomicrobium sp. CS1GBMeth3]